MAIEPRRGCGYRKVNGLYLVGGTLGEPCCKLPFALEICPTCAGGVKQSRGWQWIDPKPWLNKRPCVVAKTTPCPAADPEKLGERVGLLWIGTQFYRTADEFCVEADKLGVSRRIQAIPRNFKVGEDWVFLAHPKTMISGLHGADRKPGVFRLFRPTAIEKIVTETQFQDQAEMAKLIERGITPVVVPDDDRDHQGSVYDDDDDVTLDLEPGALPQQPTGDQHAETTEPR